MKSFLTEQQIEDLAQAVENHAKEMTDQQFKKLQDCIDSTSSLLAVLQNKHRKQTGGNRWPRISLDKIQIMEDLEWLNENF